MSTISGMLDFLRSILMKTREKSIRWDIDAGPAPGEGVHAIEAFAFEKRLSVSVSRFVCHVPNLIIRFRFYETGESNPHAAIFRIEQPGGGVLGEWFAFTGSQGWEDALQLFEILNEQVSRPQVSELLSSLEQEKLEVIENIPLAFNDAEKSFYARVAGEWNLTYYRNNNSRNEQLRIDDKGYYFIPRSGPNPWFHLADVYFDPVGMNVSFAKVEMRGEKIGKTRQVEVLQIDPNWKWMKGYAQHDRHRLEYVRMDS